MATGMRGKALLAIIVVIVVCIAGLSIAQDQPADNMQIVKEKIQADKKLFIAANLGLTETEAQAFWPVYESYQEQLGNLNSRTGSLIQEYADSYQSMSNETAKKLLDDSLAIENDRLKLRQDYLPKFRKLLPDIKVGRYYQLENKIHAVVAYDLARQIPLVK